jgi:hypothetical protein
VTTLVTTPRKVLIAGQTIHHLCQLDITFDMTIVSTCEKVHNLSPWVSYSVEGIIFKKINPQVYVCLGVSTNGTQFGNSPFKNK